MYLKSSLDEFENIISVPDKKIKILKISGKTLFKIKCSFFIEYKIPPQKR